MTQRMYPAYTTDELRTALAGDTLPPANRAKIEAEVIARESGASVAKVTPQIEGGKVQHIIGRI